ncbi:MAG TPA: hypothetical protein DIT13_14235 [Verrucomicrobiales bacterium]|nr:hypothetical protein [Verrucomicrobiales bacterium]
MLETMMKGMQSCFMTSHALAQATAGGMRGINQHRYINRVEERFRGIQRELEAAGWVQQLGQATLPSPTGLGDAPRSAGR